MKARISNHTSIEYDDAGNGPPVVLLHAFPLSREMWRPQVNALKDDCRLIIPDLRGFGGTSPFDQSPSLEQMADDVAALLTTLNLDEPLVLGGLSMGSYVALAFVRKYPERVRALLLADSRAAADTAEGKANRDTLIAFAKEHSAADVIEQMLPKMVSEETRSQRPEVVNEVRRIAAAQTTASVIALLRALRDRPDMTPYLGGIKAPTLVIVGAEDTLTPPSMAQALQASIPGARLETISGAGHLSNLEKPEAFNAAVRSFVQSMAGKQSGRNVGAASSTPLVGRFRSPVKEGERRWLDGFYLDNPDEWDDPYRFFRW